jgi:sulfopyruvate decarboxylase subunit beta
MRRHECLAALAEIAGDAIGVTTASTTLEWSNLRPSEANLRVRTLGLASSVGLGLALTLPRRKIVVLDGDGALLLNLSSLATLGWQRPPNLVHIVFVNGMYAASGGERNAAGANADLVGIARSAGYPHSVWAETIEEFRADASAALEREALSFIGARVEPGGEPPMKAVRIHPVENKFRFIRHIEQTEGRTILPPAFPGGS